MMSSPDGKEVRKDVENGKCGNILFGKDIEIEKYSPDDKQFQEVLGEWKREVTVQKMKELENKFQDFEAAGVYRTFDKLAFSHNPENEIGKDKR
jgi:hypothetical protein